MCTAIFYNVGDGYFGRTLDLEYSYNETVTVTPRRFLFEFRFEKPLFSHYAIIGMATVEKNYPLYYDAVNEKGLCMAGLNFPHSAVYHPKKEGKTNIASFELIPFVLGQCKSVPEAKSLLSGANICDMSFSSEYKATPLHWIISDRTGSIVVESDKNGLNIYDNKVGVMTNEPPFESQVANFADYANLTSEEPKNSTGLPLCSRGTGAKGLPGDFSSSSRFVRAAFVLQNSLSGEGEEERVGQFFRMLGTVEVPRGCVRLRSGESVITHYTSCMNMSRGIYYYKTYGNSRISAVNMNNCDLYGDTLISYPLNVKEDVFMQN